MTKTREQGQTSLEMTVALILVVMLLVASVKVFLWLNEGIVNQQVGYEDTRLTAGAQMVASGSVDLNNPATTEGVRNNAPRIQVLNLFR